MSTPATSTGAITILMDKSVSGSVAAFKQGNLYVNVHSAGSPSGEIRGQLGQ